MIDLGGAPCAAGVDIRSAPVELARDRVPEVELVVTPLKAISTGTRSPPQEQSSPSRLPSYQLFTTPVGGDCFRVPVVAKARWCAFA